MTHEGQGGLYWGVVSIGLFWPLSIRDVGLLRICALFVDQLPRRHIKGHQRTQSLSVFKRLKAWPTLPLSRSVALGLSLPHPKNRDGLAAIPRSGSSYEAQISRRVRMLGKLQGAMHCGLVLRSYLFRGAAEGSPLPPSPPVQLQPSPQSGPALGNGSIQSPESAGVGRLSAFRACLCLWRP